MIAFIAEHRGAYGLEPRSGSRPICRVLPIAPSIYHEHVARRGDPSRMPARAKRDAELRREVQRVFEENLRVYGVRKMWHQLRREGFQVARWVVLQASKDWCGRVHCCNPDQCRFQTSPVTPPGCPWRAKVPGCAEPEPVAAINNGRLRRCCGVRQRRKLLNSK